MKKLILLLVFFTKLQSLAQNRFEITAEGAIYGIKEKGNWILQPKYDSIIQVSSSVFITKQKRLYGFFIIQTNGIKKAEDSPCKFTDFRIIPSDDSDNFRFAMKRKKLFAIYDYHGKQRSGFEYEDLAIMPSVAFYKKPGEKWNLVRYLDAKTEILNADSVKLVPNYWTGTAFVGKHADQSYDKIIYVDMVSTYEYKYNPDWGKKKIWAESLNSHLGYYYQFPVHETGYIMHTEGGYKTVKQIQDGMFIVWKHNKMYDLLNSNFEPLIGELCLEMDAIPDHCVLKIERKDHFLPNRHGSTCYALYNFIKNEWVYKDAYLVKKLSDEAVIVRRTEKDPDFIYFTDKKKEYDITWFTKELLIVHMHVEKDNNQFRLYGTNGIPLNIPVFESYTIHKGELFIMIRNGSVKKNYQVTTDGKLLE